MLLHNALDWEMPWNAWYVTTSWGDDNHIRTPPDVGAELRTTVRERWMRASPANWVVVLWELHTFSVDRDYLINWPRFLAYASH